jgi:hypothetical protein
MNILVRFPAALAVAACGLGATSASAQTSSVDTTGSTTIIRPVTIEQSSGLAFGTIVRPTSGSSTISIGTDSDTATKTGGAILLRGTQSRAKYTIRGEGGETVSVSMPTTFNMTRTGGSETLAVALTRNPSGNIALSNALGAEGTAALNVGGSFAINDTTATGAYQGTFTVSVSYN